MYGQDACSTYLENQVQTQPPEKLVLMLYDGALRFLRQGKEAILAKKYDRTSYYLGRAEDILAELTASLNLEAGEVATNLRSLYDFLYRRLVEANVEKNPDKVDEVYRLLNELRDAWEKATCPAVGKNGQP